jgi:O-methyltransferase
LQNLEDCISTIVREDISGDIIETGVWRGGACIFMVAALRAFGDDSRVVWMADSFQGLPQPSGKYEADLDGPQFWRFPELAVGEADVVANFERYGLWDPKRVRILKGWFEDTLPTAPVTELALLRLDGDMYESTLCSLNSLYPRLQPGGFCIVDDYGSVPACQQAVEDYRKSHDVTDEVMWVDKECVYWRRGR